MSSLPFIETELPQDVRNFLDRVREILTDTSDSGFVRVRDLVSAGTHVTTTAGLTEAPADRVVSLPTKPLNVEARGAFGGIIVTWSLAGYAGHSHAALYWGETNVRADSVAVATGTHGVGFIPYLTIDNAPTAKYVWVRFVNVEEQVGPWHDINGIYVEPLIEPGWLGELFLNQIGKEHLTTVLRSDVDLITASSDVEGSVAWRVKQESDARVAAFADEVAARDQAIVDVQTDIERADGVLSARMDTKISAVTGSLNGSTIEQHLSTLSTADATEASRRDTLMSVLLGTGQDPDNLPASLGSYSYGLIGNIQTTIVEADKQVARSAQNLAVGAASALDAVCLWTFDVASDVNDWTFDQCAGYVADGALVQSSVATASTYITSTRIRTSLPERTATNLTLTSTGTYTSPTLPARNCRFNGAEYPIVRLRMNRLAGSGTSWGVRIGYTVVIGNTTVGTYKAAPRPLSNVEVGDWYVLDVDMSTENNWKSGIITQLHIYTTAQPSGAAADRWMFDYIAVGKLGAGGSRAEIYDVAEVMRGSFGNVATRLSEMVVEGGDIDTKAAAKITDYEVVALSADEGGSPLVDENGNYVVLTKGVTIPDAFKSLAYSNKQLKSESNDNKTTIETVQTTVDGIKGLYAVKINNNGNIAGFGLQSALLDNGTVRSSFTVAADSFAVVPPNTNWDGLSESAKSALLPFAVVGGKTYIKSAYIEDGTITNAKIEALDGTKITGNRVTGISLRGGSIEGGLLWVGGSANAALMVGGSYVASGLAQSGNVIRSSPPSGQLLADQKIARFNLFHHPENITAYIDKNVVAFNASKFVVYNRPDFDENGNFLTGTFSSPFEVVDNKVYIREAVIRDGSITTAKIGDVIKSSNYNGVDNFYPVYAEADPSSYIGTAGWMIGKNGAAVFNDVFLRGRLYAESFETSAYGVINTSNVVSDAISGAYSGEIAAATLAVYPDPSIYRVSHFSPVGMAPRAKYFVTAAVAVAPTDSVGRTIEFSLSYLPNEGVAGDQRDGPWVAVSVAGYGIVIPLQFRHQNLYAEPVYGNLFIRARVISGGAALITTSYSWQAVEIKR